MQTYNPVWIFKSRKSKRQLTWTTECSCVASSPGYNPNVTPSESRCSLWTAHCTCTGFSVCLCLGFCLGLPLDQDFHQRRSYNPWNCGETMNYVVHWQRRTALLVTLLWDVHIVHTSPQRNEYWQIKKDIMPMYVALKKFHIPNHTSWVRVWRAPVSRRPPGLSCPSPYFR